MAIKVTCINKDHGNHDNPYEAIEYLGWTKDITNEIGKYSRARMVQFLENHGIAYVEKGGEKAYLIVRTSTGGNKYVKTEADSTEANNLLELPEC